MASCLTVATESLGHRSTRRHWLVLVLIGAAFFLIEHDLSISREDSFGTAAEKLEANAAQGQRASQIGISLLAAIGLWCLWRESHRPWSCCWPLATLILLFLAWCAASTLWSIDRSLTVKRLGVLYLCFAGALGLAGRLRVRELCQAAWIIPLCYIVIGFGAEMGLKTLRPFAADYRFAGTLHPNSQGGNCAMLVLASVLLLGSTKRKRWFVTLLIVGAACLILTKSRTECGALIAALMAVSLLRCSPRTLAAGGVAAGATVALIALIAQLSGPQSWQEMKNAALLGRQENTQTFNGRTELWDSLISYAQRRPLAGYGYRSFWTPDHIRDVSTDLYWGISSAHSFYLETALSVGLVGGAILLVVGFTGLFMTARRYRSTGDPGYGLIFALLVFGAVGGLTESTLISPSLDVFLVGTGLLHLAFFAGRDGSEIGEEQIAA